MTRQLQPATLMAIFLLQLIQQSHAAVQPATLFQDGVVLQRDKPVAVWGVADPGEQVTVEFKGQTQRTETGKDGRWLIHLNPLQASVEPAELVIRSENSVVLRDVLVGDVWLCSGQSNMNLPLSATDGAKEAIAQADHPLIRYFEVRSSILEEPVEFAEGAWQVCSPDVAGRFTAVGYYFSKAVQQEIEVPIGIIKATLGGSPIEGWIAAADLKTTPASEHAFKEWQGIHAGYEQRADEHRKELAEWRSRSDAALAAGEKSAESKPIRAWVDSDRKKPGGLYNGFIHPLEPFTLAGILWYQGEGNVPRSAEYKALFPMLIQQWRRDFKQPHLPFLFVQLPNYKPRNDRTGETWPHMREAQTAALTLSNVGMAVTTDIGDPVDLHPGNKKAVGDRLALIALRMVHGRKVVDSGPVAADVSREGSKLRVHFSNAKGLSFRGDSNGVFSVAGPDQNFVRADARIDGKSVVVTAKEVSQPIAVRLNWENNPQGVLVNQANLPAAPFRSDDW